MVVSTLYLTSTGKIMLFSQVINETLEERTVALPSLGGFSSLRLGFLTPIIWSGYNSEVWGRA